MIFFCLIRSAQIRPVVRWHSLQNGQIGSEDNFFGQNWIILFDSEQCAWITATDPPPTPRMTKSQTVRTLNWWSNARRHCEHPVMWEIEILSSGRTTIARLHSPWYNATKIWDMVGWFETLEKFCFWNRRVQPNNTVTMNKNWVFTWTSKKTNRWQTMGPCFSGSYDVRQ